MTGTLSFYDAAFPPSPAPSGFDGVAFYIGGDTPHVWTLAEINAQRARYRLPIFVRSNPPGPGADADVAAALRQLHAIGCPRGNTLVAWDMETAADGPYIQQVYTDMRAAGYTLLVYGSLSTVAGNRNPDGLYWGADWTNRPGLQPGTVMTQWVSRAVIDVSTAEAVLPFWDTQPGPPPASNWTETMIATLPTLQTGAQDSPQDRMVHRVQGLCVALGAGPLVIDGVFGPATASAVKTIQAQFQLAQDGIVGQQTWTALVAGQ